MFQGHNRDNKTQTNYNIVIIVMLPFIILLLAWIALKLNITPLATVNNGSILKNEVKLSDLDIKIVNQHIFKKNEAPWKLMLVGCSAKNNHLCQDMIYKTAQVIKALGKNSDKIFRIYLVNHQEDRDDLNAWKEIKNSVYAYDSNNNLEKNLNLLEWPEANVFLVDPLGRIIMRYLPTQTGKGLLNDLKKLLHNAALNMRTTYR